MLINTYLRFTLILNEIMLQQEINSLMIFLQIAFHRVVFELL